MAKTKEEKAAEKAEKEAAKEAEKAAKAAEKAAAKLGGGEKVDVFENGNFVRSYSEEVHGEKFLDLANEFVAKKGGRSLK